MKRSLLLFSLILQIVICIGQSTATDIVGADSCEGKSLQVTSGKTKDKENHLDWLGELIRINAGSDFSKAMFERYWTGGGDYTLTISEFNDLISQAIYLGTPKSTVLNACPAYSQGISLYGSPVYKDAIGTATIYLDMDKSPIGFYDEYNFNVFPFRWNNIEAEIKIILVKVASLLHPSAKMFDIRYP